MLALASFHRPSEPITAPNSEERALTTRSWASPCELPGEPAAAGDSARGESILSGPVTLARVYCPRLSLAHDPSVLRPQKKKRVYHGGQGAAGGGAGSGGRLRTTRTQHNTTKIQHKHTHKYTQHTHKPSDTHAYTQTRTHTGPHIPPRRVLTLRKADGLESMQEILDPSPEP
jgi:hypothetical protein